MLRLGSREEVDGVVKLAMFWQGSGFFFGEDGLPRLQTFWDLGFAGFHGDIV